MSKQKHRPTRPPSIDRNHSRTLALDGDAHKWPEAGGDSYFLRKSLIEMETLEKNLHRSRCCPVFSLSIENGGTRSSAFQIELRKTEACSAKYSRHSRSIWAPTFLIEDIEESLHRLHELRWEPVIGAGVRRRSWRRQRRGSRAVCQGTRTARC